MAKKTRQEFLSDISNIVEESMSQTSNDNSKKFGIRKHVIGLLEAGQKNPKLMSYLNRYDNILKDKTTKEFMIYEQFGKGLIDFSNVKAVKSVITEMNENLMENGNILKFYKLLENVQDRKAQSVIKEAYDAFIADADYDSRENLMDALDALEAQGDPVAPKLIIVLTDTDNLPQIELGTPESKFDEIQKKLKDDAHRRKMQDILNQINDYANRVFDEAQAENEDATLAEQEANCFDAVVNSRGLCLEQSIKTLAKSDAKSNARLMEVLNQYAGALNQGLYEERLYEGYVRNITPYSYLLPVEKEIKRINEVATKNAVSIELTKILEEMSGTNSYYLLPIVEEDVCRYINNPNPVNKAQVKAALVTYASDAYCHAMLEAIEKYSETKSIKEEVLSMKDRLSVLKENATVSNIYSPIQYIKDGECVFNANGQFFVKKGNTLATLSDEYLPQLSESFVSLCQLLNDPHVHINDDADDSIVLLGNNKIANIFEGYVTINGNRETVDTLRNLNEMSMKYDFDNNFFIMASCLLENFNKIAKVDFAKHIQLNENAGITVDLFRLNNSIFINAVNENMNQETFYQNVNPLQCKSIINRHMGMNVSALFEDLLPSQDKIIMKLNEAKDGYEAAIEKYETTLEKLKAAKESCTNEENNKKLDDAIESAETKLDEIKKEYKEWQKEVDKEVNAEDSKDAEEAGDGETLEEPQTEPIDADEVDDVKPSLTEPISGGADAATNEEDPVISDEEFAEYLDGEEPVPAPADETEEPIDTIEEPADDDILPAPAPEDLEDDSNDPIEGQEGDGFKETELPEETPEAEMSDDEASEVEAMPEDDEEEIDIVDNADGEGVDIIPETAPENTQSNLDNLGFKIANVSFDQNIKTNEIFKTGNVIVIIPKVSADGNMIVQPETFTFYIDADTKQPIIAAENIPVSVYNEILNAITSDPLYDKAESSESPKDEVNPVVGTYIDAKDAEKDSAEIDANDDNEFFNIEDTEDGLTISPKEDAPVPAETEEEDDINILTSDDKVHPEVTPEETEDVIPSNETPELPDDLFDDLEDEEGDKDGDEDSIAASIFGSSDDSEKTSDETEEPIEIAIPTYKSEDGKTDIEFPAPEAEDEEDEDELIPEEPKKPKVNESIIDIKSFFVNEGASKPSKKEVKRGNVNEGEIGQRYMKFEDMHSTPVADAFSDLHEQASEYAAPVSNITAEPCMDNAGGLYVFTIGNQNDNENCYAIYYLKDKIYYRKASEFVQIIEDTIDEYPEAIAAQLESDYMTGEPMDYVGEDNIEDVTNILEAIVAGISVEPITESIKIKRPKLSSEHDPDKSKKIDEITNGTKEDKDFKEKIEKDAAKNGVENPMIGAAQPAEEAVKPQILPNVHNTLTEADKSLKDLDIEYEPMDWVIFKENKMKGQVQSLVTDYDGKVTLLNVIASDGNVYSVKTNEIEPDPIYLQNIPGVMMNSQATDVPRLAHLDIDPKTRMPNKLKNDKPGDMKDLNGK